MSDYKDVPEPRHVLPARRPSDTIRIAIEEGNTIYLTVGFDPTDTGRPREVFYSAGFRSGSQMEFLIQDACVMISLLLQHGHHPAGIAKSLARQERPDGEIVHASVIGLILDELIQETAQE